MRVVCASLSVLCIGALRVSTPALQVCVLFVLFLCASWRPRRRAVRTQGYNPAYPAVRIGLPPCRCSSAPCWIHAHPRHHGGRVSEWALPRCCRPADPECVCACVCERVSVCECWW
ncbi:hypothetical protein FOCC_FOCC000144 [Frankliniella occidentalis]|nr:hypothetical protein FOCC_FOCC000144 [Frankliniella occidentalis]